MLKQKLHQQSSSSSSNAHSGDQQDSSQYEVSELANSQCVEETSLLLKLTDECTAAIQCAIKAKCPIRMHVQDKVSFFQNKLIKTCEKLQVATIEVQDRDGNSLNFKCSLQNQQPTDVIFYNPKEKIYKNVGSTTTVKMQVWQLEMFKKPELPKKGASNGQNFLRVERKATKAGGGRTEEEGQGNAQTSAHREASRRTLYGQKSNPEKRSCKHKQLPVKDLRLNGHKAHAQSISGKFCTSGQTATEGARSVGRKRTQTDGSHPKTGLG